jgi:hypothetical protein
MLGAGPSGRPQTVAMKSDAGTGRSSTWTASASVRRVSMFDFLATVCWILGIDYTKENSSPGCRPVRIVDNGNVRPIEDLLR